MEKYELHDDALRFVELQMENDMSKAGTPDIKWNRVIALACKGRVMAKLGRHSEALKAFFNAVTVSKESYRIMEPLALQELVKYHESRRGSDGYNAEAAAQAQRDFDAKLAAFGSEWLTLKEFQTLRITAGDDDEY